MRIRVKFQLVTSALIIAVAAAIAVMVIRTQGAILREQSLQRLDAIMEGASRIAKESFDGSDRLMALSYMMLLQKEYPELKFAEVRFGEQQLKLGAENKGLLYLERGDIQGRAPSAGGQVTLRFGFDREAIDGQVRLAFRPFIRRIAVIAGIFLLLGLIATLLTARLLTGPVEELAAATRRVAEGEMDFQVPVHGNDELGTLTRAFNAMTGRIKELLDSREDILHTITHEINTPLNGLKAYLELWQDGRLPGEADRKRVLDTMMTSVVRMESSLGNALELFKGEHSPDKAPAKPVLVNDIFRHAVAMFAKVAEEKQVRIFPFPSAPVCIIAPEEPIRQIVMNLVSNAVKYTPAGGQIRLGIDDSEEEVCLQVSNTGYGIPPEDLPHLFTKFYRSDAERASGKRIPGTGLGLNIVRKAVDSLGGRVWVESELGKNTMFFVRLPKSRLNAASFVDAEDKL